MIKAKTVIVILVMMTGCSNAPSNPTPSDKSALLAEPSGKKPIALQAADVSQVSAQQFTSILVVSPCCTHYKKFLGYENSLAYLEVGQRRNEKLNKEIYCTPINDLPKHVIDSLESMAKQ